MAWLTRLSPWQAQVEPNVQDTDTFAYWVGRLKPLVESLRGKHWRQVTVVLANRCGAEKGVVYAGTSTVFRIHDGCVYVLGVLGKAEERCLVVDDVGYGNKHAIYEFKVGQQKDFHVPVCN